MSYKAIGIVRGKKVKLTFHAEERAETRQISQEEILKVLKDKLITVPGTGKTSKVYGNVKGRRIVVYIEEKSKEIIVTTLAAPEEG